MALEKWEIAWLAGIFEGEGSISFTNENSAQARIQMSDHDVIQTIDDMIPSPNGIIRYDYATKKTQWKWQLSGRNDVIDFLKSIYPYLHSRRQAKVHETVQRLASNRGSRSKRTHCSRGHEFNEANTYIAVNGTRHCRVCSALLDHKRYHARKALR